MRRVRLAATVAAQRVIGVDLGGTKILAGVVTREGVLDRHRELATPLGSQEALLDGLETAVRDVLDDDIAAVGFGIPSRVDRATGVVAPSVNVPLGGIALGAVMADRFGLPIGIENDGNAATYAEFVAGAGRDVHSLVMLTLGTGVGGGAVLDGTLFRGWAEFGHVVIVEDGEPCFGACTGHGHLEAYVSGSAATRDAQRAFGPAADAHRLVRLAQEGDHEAVAILEHIGRHLGTGIGSLINIFDPELVLIGGGFAAAGDFILRPAADVARVEALDPAKQRVTIVRAQLGTMAGVIGAGLIGFEAADGAAAA
jgi:glucokinase